MDITLEQLLDARDHRRQRQQQLLAPTADDDRPSTLLCLTIVMPGTEKRNRQSLALARAAVDAITDALLGTIVYQDTADLPTGFEGYFLTSLPPIEAKRLACRIEDTHPLGRLFDIDVMGTDGVPIERQSIGLTARKCLLCDNDARVCMRAQSHSTEQLLQRIREMVSAYVRQH